MTITSKTACSPTLPACLTCCGWLSCFRSVTEMEGFNSHLNMEQMNKASGGTLC